MKKPILTFMLVLASAMAAAPVQAAMSGGVVVSQPGGFGGYGSFWPSDLVTIDGVATHRIFDVGITGHIPLTDTVQVAYDFAAPAQRRGPAHRLLVAGSFGRVHNAFDAYVIGTHLGAAIGYGYQTEWDLRLLAGVGGFNGVGWAWAPMFSVMAGRVF